MAPQQVSELASAFNLPPPPLSPLPAAAPAPLMSALPADGSVLDQFSDTQRFLKVLEGLAEPAADGEESPDRAAARSLFSWQVCRPQEPVIWHVGSGVAVSCVSRMLRLSYAGLPKSVMLCICVTFNKQACA